MDYLVETSHASLDCGVLPRAPLGVLSNIWSIYCCYLTPKMFGHIWPQSTQIKDKGPLSGKVLWVTHQPACGQIMRKPVCRWGAGRYNSQTHWLWWAWRGGSDIFRGPGLRPSSGPLGSETPFIFATTFSFSLSKWSQLGRTAVRESLTIIPSSPWKAETQSGFCHAGEALGMHLHVQTWPSPSPPTLQWACGLLAWAGRTELLKVST